MTQKVPCKHGDMISISDSHIRERKRTTSVLYDLHLCSKTLTRIPYTTYTHINNNNNNIQLSYARFLENTWACGYRYLPGSLLYWSMTCRKSRTMSCIPT